MFKGISEGKFPAFSRKTTENVSVYKIYVSIYNFVFEKWKKCGILQFREDISRVSERKWFPENSGRVQKAKQETISGNDPHRKGEY